MFFFYLKIIIIFSQTLREGLPVECSFTVYFGKLAAVDLSAFVCGDDQPLVFLEGGGQKGGHCERTAEKRAVTGLY